MSKEETTSVIEDIKFPAGSYPVSDCPCCGAEIDKTGIFLDKESKIIVLEGRALRLPNKEFLAFRTLFEAYPKMVTDHALITGMYDYSYEPENEFMAVAVRISHLRAKLKPFGIEIIRIRDQDGFNKAYKLNLRRKK